MIPQFKNNQLQSDLNKLLDDDSYCYSDITSDYDIDLGYILDIKDNAYFYSNESDRNFDDNIITTLLSEKFDF